MKYNLYFCNRMAILPQAFTEQTRQLMGDVRFERYLKAFDAEEAPVSIRLNPRKTGGMMVADGEQVPWCCDGYYLKQRPQFTMDPLLHAGCYYVQEAASMFLDEVLRQCIVHSSESDKAQPNYELKTMNYELKCLDLCAAPGGKSTLLRSALPDECALTSNEPMRQRYSILEENVTKWGGKNHIVTNQYAQDFRKQKQHFDLILADVPCSGEGMFRKDPATIQEWSPQQVEKCCALQRDIVSDIWPCLKAGGLFIYSTCTFNTKENEENIRWILDNFDAEAVPIATQTEWNITGSLLEGFTDPVYRFIPGITRSEGLFMCVLRKAGVLNPKSSGPALVKSHFTTSKGPVLTKDGKQKTGNSKQQTTEACARVELDYKQAVRYLRGEALVLSEDTPRGIVEVTFMGHGLGQMKNIGTRANNLYPKPWRIKTTHVPETYTPILIAKSSFKSSNFNL